MASNRKSSSTSIVRLDGALNHSNSMGSSARNKVASRESSISRDGKLSRTQAIKLHHNTNSGVIRRGAAAPKEDSVKDYLLIVNEYSSKP